MREKGQKNPLPLKVKVWLNDGRTIFLQGGKIVLTPIGVNIVELDKPNITRMVPWHNIKELEIPGSMQQKKVIEPGQEIHIPT